MSRDALFIFKEKVKIFQHHSPMRTLGASVYHIVSNQCCREEAVIVMPCNWVGFTFNCRIKHKKTKLSFTALQWKLGHSLTFLDFKFGRTTLL